MSDKKITEYKTVSAFEEAKIGKLVAAHLAEGWQPLGPVSVTTYQLDSGQGDSVLMVQTLVKYE